MMPLVQQLIKKANPALNHKNFTAQSTDAPSGPSFNAFGILSGEAFMPLT
jgi:hypothetical protein